jgi:hypothetical protein
MLALTLITTGIWGLQERTQHVSFAVLATMPIRNIRLDAEIEHGEILDGVLLRVQAADDPETPPGVDVLADPLKLLA